jgi:transposase-like protein
MPRSTNRQQQQAQWRALLERQAQSGQSVAAFCRNEGIPAQTFYWWRARLAKDSAPAALRQPDAAPFIDLGVLGDVPSAGINIRLELPGGIVLTIARG